MRFNFSNFGTKLWKVPKYLPDIPKIVEIYRPEFKVHCIFTHNTNIDKSFFTIKSDIIFMSDKYHLEESCKFTNYRKEKFQLIYSFIEKNQEEQMFIFEKEIGILPIKKVENLLDENKDKCIVS